MQTVGIGGLERRSMYLGSSEKGRRLEEILTKGRGQTAERLSRAVRVRVSF